ncbi:MAG: Uma2 family endonuclease [Microcoleaceae cyanobacterium]
MHSTMTLEIPIPTSIVLHVTHEQFTELAINNPDLKLELTQNGELIVNPPTGGESSRKNSSLTTQLGIWYEKNENLGVVFDSSGGFVLPNGAIRSPDASWVIRERWEALTSQQRRGFVPLCPDFVVELRSATDSLSKLQKKMQEYINNGAKLGWLLDPQNKQVEIYRIGKDVEILENPTELSGENILPEFTLNLKRIFR